MPAHASSGLDLGELRLRSESLAPVLVKKTVTILDLSIVRISQIQEVTAFL